MFSVFFVALLCDGTALLIVVELTRIVETLPRVKLKSAERCDESTQNATCATKTATVELELTCRKRGDDNYAQDKAYKIKITRDSLYRCARFADGTIHQNE